MSDEPRSVQSQGHDPQQVDQLAQLTLDYLDVLNGSRNALPQLDDLSSSQRARVLAAWSSIDQLLTSEPLPALDADPTAIALGIVPELALDPAALRRTRQRKNLRPSDLAAALQARGWSTSTVEVFGWERRAKLVAPALLADLASTLDVSTTSLTPENSSASTAEAEDLDDAADTLTQALYSDDLEEVVQQWARLFDLGPSTARHDLHRRLSAAAHRGQRTLTPQQWKAVLKVLLASERARRGLSHEPGVSE